tara:strand:+ start:45 stop:167 length:123 start_codon:yes stop_codon:yes gene_type:complete
MKKSLREFFKDAGLWLVVLAGLSLLIFYNYQEVKDIILTS